MDGETADDPFGGRLREVREGPWAGWRMYWENDPFEDITGPFYWRREADGAIRCAFRAERKHLNGSGFLHGGCIMTFADYALFEIGREALGDQRGVTATFNGEFVGAVSEGQLVECTGEVVKGGKSLVFVRALITGDGEPVMSFSGVIKKVGPRKP
ncbi:MAG: hypothetical protein JWQ97_20 [Phenylobacterium sp.]|nr:hypothetical protein [Phenylobacterium sp.]